MNKSTSLLAIVTAAFFALTNSANAEGLRFHLTVG